MLRIAAFALVTSTLFVSSAYAEKFEPGCPYPWGDIASPAPLDKTCGRTGDAPGAAHQAQNRAKTNVCASGTPILLKHEDFVELQHRVKSIPHGKGVVPKDRKPLATIYSRDGDTIGEGTLVRYVGYVLEARKARSTESVNCKESDVADTDIHIDLVASPSVRNPCNSITAEMIPHGRPKMWTRPNINKIDRPVRVTGQLMFDAMHDLCKNGKPTQGNPARISLWEIHPVYALDVCRSTSLQACSAGDETVWTPFHKWLEE